ncbi:transposase [Photobacterium damselae subsp. piscicida]|nr:transposase [Photobacterium damselae subsp. piscicida]
MELSIFPCSQYIDKSCEKKGLTVGIFAALHTYGRQINFNCHIHLSIAEFGLNRHGKLKTFSFKFMNRNLSDSYSSST